MTGLQVDFCPCVCCDTRVCGPGYIAPLQDPLDLPYHLPADTGASGGDG